MKPAFEEVPLPEYIAIEGPIGVGKTTLANKIASTFNYNPFLEQPTENPFLKNFYRNPNQSALATQLFFLFQRMQQIKVYEHITLDAPTPDLVIYLQAPIEILKERITKRGNINEQYLTLDYLEKLNDAYSRFFLDYKSAPLLIVNAADINLEKNEHDYETLITTIMSNPKGMNYINPQPSFI